MRRHFAVEISLTRPAFDRELHEASRRVRFAVNADRTRLMALQSGKSPGRALHQLRHRLDSVLPIDVLGTHYPDRHGRVLLNVVLSRNADARIRQEAAATGRRPQDVLGERITAHLTCEQRHRRHRLDTQLRGLLTGHTPEEILAGAAECLLRTRPPE